MARRKKDKGNTKDFEKQLKEIANSPPNNGEIVEEIDSLNEKEYLDKQKKRNKPNLIKLDYLEKERVAQYLTDLYTKHKDKQKTLSDAIDEYDDVWRMKPISIPDDDGESPRYRTPLSTVTLEVIHAQTMNVFFSQATVMRVLPTEENDIPKVKKLEVFGNWSMENEIKLFERIDRLFHASGKNGETPYIVHWVKDYGVEIKVEPIMNPADPSEPLLDPDTKEPITQEREVNKLLYNGPRLEVFSRKDYIIPENTLSGRKDWEMRRLRISADKAKRNELEGKYYEGSMDDIGWSRASTGTETTDEEGQTIPLGDYEKEFIEFYGVLRIESVKSKEEDDKEIVEELEESFIATFEPVSQTLCALRKNKFPLKESPIGLDEFIPDDEGRQKGTGVVEFMKSVQQSADYLHNQYLRSVVQANDPFGFFAPTGNMRNEPIKIKNGFLYPTSDPQSIKIEKFPGPDASLRNMIEEIKNQAQVLFGIGDYQAGMESSIDPTAPARKAELVVQQGNNRLNLIIRRKNQTLKDIFRRWFLLYQANMPANKFMRIAGDDTESPWKFDAINLSDFALNSIPDFQLTGNVLNSNKQLKIQKDLAIYNTLILNPLFNPATKEGMTALHSLTKWLLDNLDEAGISHFLPTLQGDEIHTPEEENARFMQGDTGDPVEQEDHVYHMRTHDLLLQDASTPDDVKKLAYEHQKKHADMIKTLITRQQVMSTMPSAGMGQMGGMQPNPNMGGMSNGRPPIQGANTPPGAVL